MILDQFKLDGKTAIVTGCRRGIGKALAIALAEAGADIVGVSTEMEAEGSDIQRQITALGRKFYPFACDFSNREGLYAFIEKATKQVPQIDILINNAGMNRRTLAVEYPDPWWDQIIEVNLTAQFILAREMAKPMLARGRGKIVFIASLMTFQGGINIPAYSASKGGIGSLTMALANEWAGKGVNVNAIAPGFIATDITVPLQADVARNKSIIDRIPQGRWGKPEDMGGAAVFLCSDAAHYVHGTILAVDGGWLGR